MYNNIPLVSIIPARGGSKGLKRKNVASLCGKPLIEWTISAAKRSKYIDRIIVSTDDAEIGRIARRSGAEVPFFRPAKLAGDRALTEDAVIHVIDRLEKSGGKKWRYVVLLQPTSPLRTGNDIDSAIKEFFSCKESDALVSVSEVSENPMVAQVITEKGFLKNLMPGAKDIRRRQDLPRMYRMNGAIYICKTSVLRRDRTLCPKRTVAFIMPREKSVDIDDGIDLEMAEILMKRPSFDGRRKAV